MKKLSKNRDLFEVAAGEGITVTVEARKTPYQVTFSDIESGAQWTILQAPSLRKPTEIRRFTMPSGSREFFTLVYAFPPAGQSDPDAKYLIRFSGKDGTSDGPTSILPPASGDIQDLPYEFRLPGAPLDHFLPADLLARVVAATPVAPLAVKGGGN